MDFDGDSHKSLTVVTAITTFFTLFHMKNSTSTSEDVRHVSVYLKAWNIEYDDVLFGEDASADAAPRAERHKGDRALRSPADDRLHVARRFGPHDEPRSMLTDPSRSHFHVVARPQVAGVGDLVGVVDAGA